VASDRYELAPGEDEQPIERIMRYERLIRWLALAWADNDPWFPPINGQTGEPLLENAELKDTWFEVVRGGVVKENLTCEGEHRLVLTLRDGVIREEPPSNFCRVCGVDLREILSVEPGKNGAGGDATGPGNTNQERG
jgi:hypothetical protein